MNPFSDDAERIRTRICRRMLAAFSLIAMSTLAISAAAESLSLDEALALAVANAPMIEARDAGVTAAAEDVVRAAALPDPVLGFGVQNLPIAGADAFSLSDDRMTMRRIGVTQALPSRSKREARRESALAVQSQAEAAGLATVLAVKREVATAWIALWAAQRERSLLEELREQSRLAVVAAKARLQGAEGSVGDALAARSAELELDNRVDDAQSAIEQARAGLSRWILDDAQRELALAPDFSVLPEQESELLDQLDRQAPLLVWDAREASADAALALANAEKRPDWSVSAGIARRGAGASNVVWLEIGVGLPLFSANRQERGISARQSDLQAIRAAREDARRAQAESVRRVFAEWSSAGVKVARFDNSILPLNHDRTATALAAYSGGARLLDWLDAQRVEIRVRIEYAQLLADWGRAWAQLAWLLPAEETR
jgi:outer membrane protein, heavy metal efflux system